MEGKKLNMKERSGGSRGETHEYVINATQTKRRVISIKNESIFKKDE